MADCGETPDDPALGSSGDVTDDAPTVEKLLEKIAHLESEQQKQLRDFGTQRAKYKELYHQKEEELESVKSQNKKLSADLEEVRNELFALELQRNSYLSEKSKCDDEIASLQKIVGDTIQENQTIQDAKIILESEIKELRHRINEDKERSSDALPIGKFTQVTKSLARKVMSELGADSSANPPKESLDDDMRKAHEDAEVLRSLMVPLEAEIQGLKEKLRNADQRLREYEEDIKGGESSAEIVSTHAKCSPEEPLIQLSPSSPMEPSVPQTVNESKSSPLENKDLEAFFGSSDGSAQAASDVPKCEMCRQHESDLAKSQQQLAEVQKTLENCEKAVQRARDDLNKERTSRQELESKWSAIKDQYDEQVANLEKTLSKTEHCLSHVKEKCDKVRSTAESKLRELGEVNRRVTREIERIQNENDTLLGKHSIKARELEARVIDLPDNVPELHVLLLRKDEELITAKISAETHEQEVLLLREQLGEFQSQFDKSKEREQKSKKTIDTLEKEIEEYYKNAIKLEEDNQRLMIEKDRCEKELLQEINKKKKLEADIQGFQRQVQALQKDLDTSEHVQQDFVRLSQNLQKQLEVLRCEGTEVRWQHDEDVDHCKTCKAPFASLRKKVHCRHCGQIFCSNCLSFTVNSGPRQRPSRVCEVCHTLLVPDTAPYFSTEPPSAPD